MSDQESPSVESQYAAIEQEYNKGTPEAIQKASKMAYALKAQMSAPPEDPNKLKEPSLGEIRGIEEIPKGLYDMGKGAVNWAASKFQPRDARPDMTGKEVAGATAVGAGTGAAVGGFAPQILKGVGTVAEAGGKLLPGWVGKTVQGGGALLKTAGKAAELIPPSVRVARGAGGGAASAVSGKLVEALGGSPATQAITEVLSGGIGEFAGGATLRGGKALAGFLGNVSFANVPGTSRAIGGLLTPDRKLTEASAKILQQRLFGTPARDYVSALDADMTHRMAVQDLLRKADPSLTEPMKAAAKATAAAQEAEVMAGTATKLSNSREVAVPGQVIPQRGVAPATPKPDPASAAASSFDAAKRAAQRKGFDFREANAAAMKAEATRLQDEALKPASQIYRERMYVGVAKGLGEGKTFSSTPEYHELAQKITDMTALGSIPKSEGQKLLQDLASDRSRRPGVVANYGKRVDDIIRQWGKPAEGAPATGAAAVGAATAKEVRLAVRDAFNGYTDKLGMGHIEKKYRAAYAAEKLAQAKDELPQILSGIGKTKMDFAKAAKAFAADPTTKPFLQQEITFRLANVEVKELPKEFERLQHGMVEAELLSLQDLKQLRGYAKSVAQQIESGDRQRGLDNFRRLLVTTIVRNQGAKVGGWLGAKGGDDGEEATTDSNN